jgi:Do/DeqQ family serine protease
MGRAAVRWRSFLAGVAVCAAVWAVGDWVLMRHAQAVERQRTQAAMQAERPEVTALARAFKLAAEAAQPGVVHIAVRGGDIELSDEDLDELIRRRFPQLLPKRNEDAAEEGDGDAQREMRETLRKWLRQHGTPAGSGSGVIIDADGYILTSNHVITGREAFLVRLFDQREFDAELVGADPKTDLAVLKIAAADLQPLPFGDSDRVEIGDWVLAVGSPFGLQQTVTHGIVSAKGRTSVPGVDILYQDFLQTDAAINPGNSGGPLLNLRGEVVGINTAIATHGDGVNAGIAFTTPSNRAARIAEQLKSTGQVVRGWLGIGMDELDPTDVPIFGLRDTRGVLVMRVLHDSPAARAGLQIEDVLVEVHGVRVQGRDQLRSLIADALPGETVPMRVVRDGQELLIPVELGTQPDDLASASAAPAVEARELGALDLTARTYRPALLREPFRSSFPTETRGALIWENRRAESEPAELSRGDLVVTCNGKTVASARELEAAVRATPRGKPVELEILEPRGERRTVRIK